LFGSRGFALRLSLLLLLRRTRKARLLRTLRLGLLLWLRATAVAAALRLAFTATAGALLLAIAAFALTAAIARGTFFLARLAGALLELTDLLFHVAARLLVLLRTDLVVAAVRTAFPAFRIRLFATCAGDGFRQRHRKSARIVHFAAVDDSRRRTLLSLIDLASENTPNACWDDRRAAELLRTQTTADELRELGVEERMIEFVFPESHG
jgi:hypothetical protein